MEEFELKPCPFCGGHARFVYDLDGWPTGVYCVRCKTVCKWGLPEKRNEAAGVVMDELAKRWNGRPGGETCRQSS